MLANKGGLPREMQLSCREAQISCAVMWEGRGLTVEHDAVDAAELLEQGDEDGGNSLLPVGPAVQCRDRSPEVPFASFSGVVLDLHQLGVNVVVCRAQHLQRLHAKRDSQT